MKHRHQTKKNVLRKTFDTKGFHSFIENYFADLRQSESSKLTPFFFVEKFKRPLSSAGVSQFYLNSKHTVIKQLKWRHRYQN